MIGLQDKKLQLINISWMSGHTRKPDYSQIEKEYPKHEQKVKTTKSLINQILKMQSQDVVNNDKDFVELVCKKTSKTTSISTFDLITQKTTKIRKNKKKKKKVVSPSLIVKQEKFPPQQLYEYYSQSLNPPNREKEDDDNDEEYLPEDPQYINGIVSNMREELLETYYDDIEQDYKQWLQGMEEYPGKTFMRLLRKLADLFDDFDLQLKNEIEEQFTHPDIANYYSCECEEESAEEFKEYLTVNFPPLKDFIENFDLKDLDQYQDEARKLNEKNPLIHLIYSELLQKCKKKKKKRNKKKKKEKKTKQNSTTTTDPDKVTQIYEENEKKRSLMDEVIQNLNKMVIDDEKRSRCLLKDDWLKTIREKF